MKNDRKIIVWNVTNRCNLNCEFCFGVKKGEKEESTEECLKRIDSFKRDGIEKIVFTGGEPLLRDDLVELVKYAKQSGFYTILHTNGILLKKEKLDNLAKYLDQINLPVDGFDDESNSRMRGRGNFGKIMNVMEWLRDELDIKIVVSTVVTKLNKDCIIKIGKILPDWIFKWRVFQFRAEGRAIYEKEKFEVSSSKFDEICKQVKNEKWNFDVQCVKNEDEIFYGSYYLV